MQEHTLQENLTTDIKRKKLFGGQALMSTLPLLCAIHCISMPVLITFLPFMGFEFLESELFEWSILGVSLLFAVYYLTKDYLKHKKELPLVLALTGFVIMVVGHFTHSYHFVASMLGATFILIAYYYNWKSNKCATQCECNH